MNNLLVTGGCGFIGSNFIRYLLEESGFTGRIINVDKLTYAGNPFNLEDIEKKFPHRYVFVHTDICDQRAITKTVQRYKVDAICHFAAESHVDRSIASPDAFIQSNIIGTYTLLEVFKQFSLQIHRFHHISTDEVFGSLGDEGFFVEDTPYHPNNPYSASKASSDHLVRAYCNTYNLPITISNCSNNYGPFQFPEKLIPLTIQRITEGKEIPVYGDGQHMRDWLYVTDHCRAVWKILQEGKVSETYNIGGNNDITNLTLVETICDTVEKIHSERQVHTPKPYRDLITFVKDRPGHDRRYAIDASKIEKELNWKPKESWQSGIYKSVLWYLDNSGWISDIESGEYRRWIERQYAEKPKRSDVEPGHFRFC